MKNCKCQKLNLIQGINQEVSTMEHGGHFSSTNIARYFNRHKGERDEKDPGNSLDKLLGFSVMRT